jgi:hypothetical protein
LRRNRAPILAAAKSCFYCHAPATQVDHIIPVSVRRDDSRANLVPACEDCNGLRGDRLLKPTSTIAIVGPAAVGKTTLARALEQRTGWAYLSIDGYRAVGDSWDQLVEDLQAMTAAGEPAITESIALQADYRSELIVRRATLVTLDLPEPERLARLEGRGGAFPRDRRWDDRDTCHAVLDGTAEWPERLLDQLVELATSRSALLDVGGRGNP